MNTLGAVMHYIENLRNFIRTSKNVGLEVNTEKKNKKHRKVLNKTGNVRIT